MEDKILLAHGSGGKLSHDLLKNTLLRLFDNPLLSKLDDSAVFDFSGRLAFTTDSYVVTPIFFPGGDIGKLAVCGTVNDLSMAGATPLYLSLSLIIEEGFPMADLENILLSILKATEDAAVKIIAGDTKVVHRGNADKIFINTSGVGLVPNGLEISSCNARVGDKIILSGTIGEHGIALLGQREGLRFEPPLQSDCAPLNSLVNEMIEVSKNIHCLRDPTRGGLASALNEFAESSNVGIRIDEEAIPIQSAVQAVCELMGFDPLHIANEGKLVALVVPQDADKVLARMRQNRYGEQARIIGEVVPEHPRKVVMKTPLGTSRILDMLTGELLPRIC
ncbi:MAG: hydrogenase expression/formation protein HypE [Proteobacteria bacterium]|nr:hydrogenase expression/formation protein HypE [Pseudomonadota bacterium]